MQSPNSGDRPPGSDGPGDEFTVIDRLRQRFEAAAGHGRPGQVLPPRGDIWIGDDAAVVTPDAAGQAVWSTDLVVEGVHVDLGLSGLDDLGYKAMMVAVSDLAAMGVRPGYALLSLVAPPGTDLDLVAEGASEASAETGCPVIGGDLSGGTHVVISVAVLGWAGSGPAPPLLRSGARPGDRLFMTGPLGGSAAGLRLLRAGSREWGSTPGESAAERVDHPGRELVSAYRRPRARLDEGQVARGAGATAAIDISDGLVSELRHLGRASGVAVVLEDLPVAAGATDEEALGGGEDYELLLAVPDPDGLVEAFRVAGLRKPLAVGYCAEGAGEFDGNGQPLPMTGWRHRF